MAKAAMSHKRVLYITDAMLERKGACRSMRDRINEVLGTRSRKVPVNLDTARAVEHLFGRLYWAADYLMTPVQVHRFYRARDAAFAKLLPPGQVDRGHKREAALAQTFVDAYYSPKK